MTFQGVLLHPAGYDDNEYARNLAEYLFDQLVDSDMLLTVENIYKFICKYEDTQC